MTAPYIGYFDVYIRYPSQKISIFSFVLFDQTSMKVLSVKHFIRSSSQKLKSFLMKSLLEVEALTRRKQFLPVFQHTGSYEYFLSKLSVPTLKCFKYLVKHCVEMNKILPSCLRFIETQNNAGKTLQSFAQDILGFKQPDFKSLSDTCKYHLNAIGLLNYQDFYLDERLRNPLELDTSIYLQARREILIAMFISLWHMKRGPKAYFVNNSFEKYAGLIASSRYCVMNSKLCMSGQKTISVSIAETKSKISKKEAQIIRLFKVGNYPNFQVDFCKFVEKEISPILMREQQIELNALMRKKDNGQHNNEDEEGWEILDNFEETKRQMHLKHTHYQQQLELNVLKVSLLTDMIFE